jgi:hypothetical protein
VNQSQPSRRRAGGQPTVTLPETIELHDGALVEVRPLERGDRAALAAAAARLSPRTMYLRFAAPKPYLTERDLDWLTDLEHHAREALVAVDPVTREGVAVARYAELPEQPRVVDVAVTVNDVQASAERFRPGPSARASPGGG